MATPEPSSFPIHQQTHLFMDDPVHIQIIVMQDSLFVWIGKTDGAFNDLSLAMPGISASSTTLVGKDIAETSRNIAHRLGKCSIFITFDHLH
ncbi:hypothetical protein BC936DRAFT_146580 [Jimgerdemannia flammicorona]|uniref:Uncharacterized protein n=2 Tax=Jimgerdemannia flammicorona TaxID=994334 RepID=A0A433QB98_9FUNG|nr:hypothetical protein BC936DRAFT_146580 [Jimgerdemannia flammicorona]RUS27009.1 hypothetical protein BC938DRAFT_483834 [Jimgerdemannia flammicorona]